VRDEVDSGEGMGDFDHRDSPREIIKYSQI
jgi:hypothetical protein